MSKGVNFDNIVQMVTQPVVGKDDLSIWGGRCAEGDLLAFLQGWGDLSSMPYRIWEYVSDIVFEKETLPENVALLQRGRLFGEDGDLEVQRDGEEFAWRFIGPASMRPPAGYDLAENDFWHWHDVAFHQYKQKALLWGERQDDKRWFEARVAGAKLDYPDVTGKRIQLHYKVFSRAGRVQFVWYTGLSEWKEVDHG